MTLIKKLVLDLIQERSQQSINLKREEYKYVSHSDELYLQAQQLMPGGVNSPVRAFHGVGGNPIFYNQAQGAYLTDVDGKRYIDYVGGWGPMIVGHSHPAVIDAVQQCVQDGWCFGTSHPLEITLAQKISDLMPHIEMMRMVNSGTEATLSVLRLARGYTHRNKIIKFAGCYHGHHDALLVSAGSGGLTFGSPTSAGLTPGVIQDTLVAQYNNLSEVTELFTQQGDDIAAIIVEPIAGNMGCIPPVPGFLAGLRALCDQHGSLLIFDEVMTGFRVARGGAQGLYGIKPDLTTFGKVIGGGFPVGAFGGRRDIMQHLAPVGNVYQAGTLSGNPVTVAAGLATLELISAANFYENLIEMTQLLTNAIYSCANAAGIPIIINQVGAMFSVFFTEQTQVNNLTDVNACDTNYFKHYFHRMLSQGIYLAPSAYESNFVSSAHAREEIELTITAISNTFATVTPQTE